MFFVVRITATIRTTAVRIISVIGTTVVRITFVNDTTVVRIASASELCIFLSENGITTNNISVNFYVNTHASKMIAIQTIRYKGRDVSDALAVFSDVVFIILTFYRYSNHKEIIILSF